MAEADVQARVSLVVSSPSSPSASDAEHESFRNQVVASELLFQSSTYNGTPQAADQCKVDLNNWVAVWCCQDAYKEDMKDTHRMLAGEIRSAGGCLIRKRSAHMFKEHWLDVHTCPYTLIVSWEITKRCLTEIEKELALGKACKKPTTVYVVATKQSWCRKATSLALSFPFWNIEVVPGLTQDHVRNLVACIVSTHSDSLEDCPVSHETIAIDTKPSIRDGCHGAGEVGTGHDVQQLFAQYLPLSQCLSSKHGITLPGADGAQIPLDHAPSQMARSCAWHDILSLSL
eukprot:TRINITY_DN90267_c0_g1_i1.p1 TRINITY_DN90267_c0_g1~~TRINITY_DN90267_c0_g1_i1.p1  ORF type:complete len:287 (+),score=25.22 TRINITY_DN90267_c0_g1_i1:60-920(+)